MPGALNLTHGDDGDYEDLGCLGFDTPLSALASSNLISLAGLHLIPHDSPRITLSLPWAHPRSVLLCLPL